MQSQTLKLVKYLTFFIASYIITKMTINDNNVNPQIIIACLLITVLYSIIDMVYPSVVIEKTN